MYLPITKFIVFDNCLDIPYSISAYDSVWTKKLLYTETETEWIVRKYRYDTATIAIIRFSKKLFHKSSIKRIVPLH